MTKIRVKRKVLKFNKENKLETKEEIVPAEKLSDNNFFQVTSSIFLVSELGISIALSITGGAYLGSLVDKRFGTNPRMTLFFLIIGFVIGIMMGYKIVRTLQNKN